jgi:anti-sigma factor RsiW
LEDALAGTGVCGEIRLELGVYVLGAIEAADRSAVDAHLECCAGCRDQLAELAGLPELLGRVSADDADSFAPYRTIGCASGHELPAEHGLRRLFDRATSVRRHRMRGAYLSRRAILGKQSGDWAR